MYIYIWLCIVDASRWNFWHPPISLSSAPLHGVQFVLQDGHAFGDPDKLKPQTGPQIWPMKIYQQNWVPKIVYPNPTRSFVPQKDLFRTCSKEKRPESAASKPPICSLSRYAFIWAMVNTHYMGDGHPIHNKDPYNGYYKSLWTIGWLAPINGY